MATKQPKKRLIGKKTTAKMSGRKPATKIIKRPTDTMKKTATVSKSPTKRVTALKTPTKSRTVHSKDIMCSFSNWQVETIELAIAHAQDTRNFVDKSKVELRPTASKEIIKTMRDATKAAHKLRDAKTKARDKTRRLAVA